MFRLRLGADHTHVHARACHVNLCPASGAEQDCTTYPTTTYYRCRLSMLLLCFVVQPHGTTLAPRRAVVASADGRRDGVVLQTRWYLTEASGSQF